MVQFVLILCFAAIHVHDGFGFGLRAASPIGSALILTGSLIALWGGLNAFIGACGRRLDATGRIRALRAAENAVIAARLLAAAAFLAASFFLGWIDTIRSLIGNVVLLDEILIIAPVLLFLLGSWSSMYPIDRRLREAAIIRQLDTTRPLHALLTRSQYVISGLRHQALLILIPLAVITTWSETADRIGTIISHRAPTSADFLRPLVEWAGIITALILTPAIIRLAWDTIPIGAGPLRDQIVATCRRHRVRVTGPLLWRTHGAMVNGAILGIFWPFRYLLLSDALLEQLTSEQVEAVTAHEVAHVRRRHLIWLAVCVLASVFAAGWAVIGFAAVADVFRDEDVLSGVATVLSLTGALLIFGLVSRRFEWQADAFAAQHLSALFPDESADSRRVSRRAIRIMSGALQAVADLNGVDTDRYSWRHGTIAERQRRLRALADAPIDRAPIDRQVKIIKVLAAAALVGSLAPIFMELLRQH